MNPDRITDLGTFSGAQLLLLVMGLVGVGIAIGQRWPTGHIVGPKPSWGKVVRVSGWACMSAPAGGMFYLYKGGSMSGDTGLELLCAFAFGVFQYWVSVPREEVEDGGQVS